MKMNRCFGDKKRGTGIRKRKPVIFLSLEGNNKTEKQYFKSLNRSNGEKYSLQFTSGHETDINNMWEALIDITQNSMNPADGDMAFCVCDRDHETYKINRIRAVKSKAKSSKLHLVVSNPCFEIWFLNHFKYSTREYSSYNELREELCQYIPCYEKNINCFNFLEDKTLVAIENSVKQIEQVTGNNLTEVNIIGNPGTEIYKIVKVLI